MGFRVKGRSRMIDILLIAALAAAGPIPAFATETHQFDVPAEDAPAAIRDFASQAHVQILVAGEKVKDKHLHAVSGELSTDQGLRLLLADSGLSPQYVGDRSIALVTASDSTTSPQATAKEGKKGIWDNFRVAQVDHGASPRATAVSNTTSSDGDSEQGSTKLEEIVVSAQKKGDERLRDVPIPVSVVNTEQLVSNDQVLLRDYYASVPGLSVTPNYLATQDVSIRGVTSGGFSTPTVGVTVDDVPFGGSTNSMGGNAVPDIDPGDLARIEVLRGPQGALYGANSMGGLIRYITKDPSTDGFSGRVEAGASDVYNGAEPGYNFRASANVPLGETFAIRVSAYTRQDPGYIDNPVLHIDGINEAESYGFRLSGLWQPSQDFSLKLSALSQNTKGNGLPEVDVPTAGYPQTVGLGNLQQNYIPQVGEYDRRVEAYSAVLKAKLGIVDLTSVTGYNINRYRDSLDYSNSISSSATQAQFGVPSTAFFDYNNVTQLTQELRLSIPIGQRIEWFLGGFYEHEAAPDGAQAVDPENPTTGQIVGQWYDTTYPRTFDEYAAFTDVTYHVTDRFDVQIGGRESQDNEHDSDQVRTGIYDPIFLHEASPIITPAVQSNLNTFTYLVTPRFKLSPDLMVYVRLASGYRPGGANSAASVSAGAPSTYSPDKTKNYEIGVKGDFLDHTLSVDASLYYIDWKNLQIQLRSPEGFTFSTNGSAAKSQGVELSAESRPLTGLTIAAWVTYDDAVLTQSFAANDPAYGLAGDRLPNTSRFSGNLSVEEDFPLTGGATGFVGAQASYVGDRESLFRGVSMGSPLPRQDFPSYTNTNVRAGVKVDSWTTNLYVNNVADTRGILNGGLGYLYPFAFIYIQPRTVGLNVTRSF
jgi:iron complex outermembrane receptor protein